MNGTVVGRPAAEIGSGSGSGSREDVLRECTPAAVQKKNLDDDCYPNQGFDHSQSAAMLNIVVSYGSTQHNVSVSPDSTFGDLKRTFAEEILIKPQMQKILFRGKEKEDCEQLQMAGVKDRSKVVLMEDTRKNELCSEQTNQSVELSKGVEAVSGIRSEVDKLSEKVSILQSVVQSGTKVDEKEIIYVTEMLMRQLLKLDGIEAEGDGKIQRKMEVRRVQSFVDTMDGLKVRNLNPFGEYNNKNNNNNSVSKTNEWEKFDSGVENFDAPPKVMPSSSTKVTQDWEQFD